MKISTKTRYGMRILLHIARASKENFFAQGRQIAEEQGISEAYLEQIMIPLKNSGLVKTQRGCKGGYILNRKLEEVSVLDVLEIFEGAIAFDTPLDDETQDNDELTAEVWKQLSEGFRLAASQMSLSDILDEKYKKSRIINYVI